MALILDLGLDILKMYLRTKNEGAEVADSNANFMFLFRGIHSSVFAACLNSFSLLLAKANIVIFLYEIVSGWTKIAEVDWTMTERAVAVTVSVDSDGVIFCQLATLCVM